MGFSSAAAAEGVAAAGTATAGTAAAATAAGTAAAATEAAAATVAASSVAAESTTLAAGSLAGASASTAAAGTVAATPSLFASLGGYGAVLSGGASLLSAASAISRGNYAAGADAIQAQNARDAGALQRQSLDLSLGRTLSRQRALYGASGVTTDSGSALDEFASTAGLTGADKFNTNYSAGVLASADLANANVARANGQAGALGSLTSFLASNAGQQLAKTASDKLF